MGKTSSKVRFASKDDTTSSSNKHPKGRSKVWAATVDYVEICAVFWTSKIRKWVVLSSLYGLWSMGIWVGFLTEPSMADTLLWVLLFDAVANTAYLLDKLLGLAEM